MRSARSNTVTRCPARFNWSAAASPAGPEPTTATRLPVRERRRLRDDPAFGERALDDRRLRRLDRHRRVVDPEHARSLARRGTQPSGELGKVVRRVQPIDGRAPPIAIDEIVPVGNQVAERAALMTERDAAVHAARRLILQRRLARRAAGLRASRESARQSAATAASAAGFRESRWPYPWATSQVRAAPAPVLDRPRRRERALVVARHHLRELQRRRRSTSDSEARAETAAGQLDVARDQIVDEREVLAVERLELHQFRGCSAARIRAPRLST